MTDLELAQHIKLTYLKTPVLTSSLFNQVIDLIIRLYKNSGGTGGTMTPEQIRDALETLVNENRLDAYAIKNLAQNVIFTNPETGFTTNIVDMVDYLIQMINEHTIQPGPGTGFQFLNDKNEWARIDWNFIINKPTKTSDFFNDGDGTSPYVTHDELVASQKETELHNFSIQSTFIISYQILSPVKAFVYVNDREVITTIEYDQDNKMVTVLMGRPFSGYVIVESLA